MADRPQPAILVVEDETVVAHGLQQTLVGLGYDAFAIASSPEQALACAVERCPDVVLIDVRIGGSADGIETAATLRQRFGASIVFVTAHADDATIDRAARIHPHGYLVKPVDGFDLRGAIEIALCAQTSERALEDRGRDLARVASQMSALVEYIQAGILVEDESRHVQHVNHRFCAMFGLLDSPDALVGLHWAESAERAVPLCADPARFVERIRDVPLSLRTVRNELVPLADGRLLERDYVPIFAGASCSGHLWTYRDVTEREVERSALERDAAKHRSMSLTDDLTGLYNRRGFRTLATQRLAVSRREGRDAILFFFDVNGLKRINDTFGHDAGDQALVIMADVLRRAFRDSDIAARLGGDEFVVLALMSPTDADGVRARLQTILSEVNDARPSFRLAISVGGVACKPHETIDALLALADRAMYAAKARRASDDATGAPLPDAESVHVSMYPRSS